MYNDNLRNLMHRLGGTPEVTRASDVEWVGGKWVATEKKSSEVIAVADTREEALRGEHLVIESRLTEYV